jgi:hypothetical protein
MNTTARASPPAWLPRGDVPDLLTMARLQRTVISRLSTMRMLLLVPLILGGCSRGADADRIVRALCRKDGGLKVFETVVVPRAQFDRYGTPTGSEVHDPQIPGKLDPRYEMTNRTEVIRDEQPSISKNTEKITRKSDGKVLAEQIVYGRSPTDSFFGSLLGMHPKGVLCPKPESLMLRVFSKGTE